ncbi:ABC transporter permease [Neorhizobium sp. JUb45]|uniref:ABC transporter permease n=1 Tax=unclassified Neorhizobium TaxID=2629175 RepID=UPI00104459DF|nr:ABC transporter permease [Neorhizobium sp. JUb45]TCR00602.1 NitT/TauT family transport system permease protein [Neorhizobium sp. JUb45]
MSLTSAFETSRPLSARSQNAGRFASPQWALFSWLRAGQFALAAVILLVIQYAVDSGSVKQIYLASPTQIVAAFPRLLFENNLLYHLYITLSEALLGFALALTLGVATGVAMGLFAKANTFFGPFLVAMMAIPKVTIIPLLTLYLGIGFSHKVFIVFLFGYFIFVFNTIAGIRQVDEKHLKVARAFGASRLQIVTKIILPSAVPSIMAAVRLEAAMCLVAALFAEIVASKAGLGNMLNRAVGVYDTASVFALVATITAIALVTVSLINLLEKRVFLRWKYV